MLRDTRNDDAVFESVCDVEAEELFHLRHTFASRHCAHADVQFFEILEGNGGFDVVSAVIILLVLLFDGRQFVELRLDGFVFDFFKEKFRFGEHSSGCEQVGLSELFPREFGICEHLTEFRRTIGKERFESNGEICHKLQRYVENRLHAFGVSFDDLPRFGVSKILVANARQVHSLLLCIAEAESVEQTLHFSLHTAEFFDGSTVALCEFSTSRHFAIVVLLRELERTIHKVAINGHKFVVVARLEISPGEIVVLRFRRICCEHIAQHVLFSGEILEIFVQPHRPVARGGDFVVFQVEEFVRRHVVGKDVGAFRLEHSWKDDAVEHNVVLADEVEQASVFRFPPFFPSVGEEFFGVGNVADGSIKPHIEHLSLCAFHRNGNTPIEVAAHGTRLQTHVEPTFALSAHVGTPFGVASNPRSEPLLVLVEREIPVLCLAQHGFRTRNLRLGVDEFGGREVFPAFFALVAIGIWVVAVRTLTGDVAVGEEGFSFFVVVLFRFALQKLPFVVEGAEKVGSHFLMGVACGARVDVEGDTKIFKRLFDELVITVYHFLHRATFFACADGYRHTVLVRTTDEEHFLFAQTEIAHVDIGGYVNTSQVADVHATVGIG